MKLVLDENFKFGMKVVLDELVFLGLVTKRSRLQRLCGGGIETARSELWTVCSPR